MKHRVSFPILLQLHHLQSLKQFLLPFEISLEGIAQKRLTESARTSQEDILVFIGKIVHHVRLVNINFTLFPDFLELVIIYRVSESAHSYTLQMRHRLTVGLLLSANI